MLLIQLSICCYSRDEQKPYTGATFVSLPGMWTTTSYLLYTNIYLTQGYSIKINAGSLRKIFKTSLLVTLVHPPAPKSILPCPAPCPRKLTPPWKTPPELFPLLAGFWAGWANGRKKVRGQQEEERLGYWFHAPSLPFVSLELPAIPASGLSSHRTPGAPFPSTLSSLGVVATSYYC